MTSNRSSSLGDIAEIVMGQSPSGEDCNRAGVGIPLLNGPTEFGSHHPIPTQFTTDPKKLSKPGDVLFCVRGSTTGRMNWSDQVYAIGRGIAAIRHKTNRSLQPLIRGAIDCDLPRLLQSATGSTFPNVSARQLASVPLPSLSLDEEISASSLLGALDDGIELNRRMKLTLEAMARAIFKDWFIDFGPTRAKMEGRAHYLTSEIWSLFPDLLDNEGKPQGWETAPLRRLGGTAIGGYWGDDQPADGEAIQYVCLRGVDLEHLRSTGSCPEAPVRWGKGQAVSKRPITECDVLVAGSGAGPCGRSLWLSNYASGLSSLPITYSNFVKRISCSSPADACFLDQVLHEMRLSGEIWSYVNGTSLPNLNDQGLLNGKSIVIPDEPILVAFMELIKLIQAKLFSHENATLAATRDLLLPKLMSGEIRVRDAEKIAEAAQ